MFKDKIIFITGGTGTWGYAIIKDLLEKYDVKKIIIFSRSEDKQVEMERYFNNSKLVFVLGDIRNKELLSKNLLGVDFVIHLAALKHIDKVELNSIEAIDINITGTKNIIEASIENNVKKVLYVSTDKAVDPYNLYGLTKATSEKLVINANNFLNNKNTIFFIVRAGNIFGSNGSVVKLFYNQIRNNVPLTITDYDMKRFYISVEEIVNLIIFGFYNSVGGEVFIPRCHVLSLKQILDTIITLYGNGKENIKQIGKRKGEKINEILISNNEIENTYIANDNYFIIDCLNKNLVKKEKVNFYEYSTKDFSGNIDYKKIKEIISNIFN